MVRLEVISLIEKVLSELVPDDCLSLFFGVLAFGSYVQFDDNGEMVTPPCIVQNGPMQHACGVGRGKSDIDDGFALVSYCWVPRKFGGIVRHCYVGLLHYFIECLGVRVLVGLTPTLYVHVEVTTKNHKIFGVVFTEMHDPGIISFLLGPEVCRSNG
ncbi:unnamed protein product [Ixodes pacificus]